jgi:hypothetical protein
MKRLVLFAFVLALGLALPCPAQFGLGKNKDDKKAEKEAKDREKEVKKAAKEANQYEKLKEFSQNLYENDLDFREAVDDHYQDILRSHSEFAYARNVNRSSTTLAIHEDRFREHAGLYDNLVVQDYVNRLGQRLVPEDSEKLFAFRLTPHPVPYAETLATGTIYISTGLVAMLDSEAQLAYVLAHEMAHVYKDHWKTKAMLEYGAVKYNEKQEKKIALWSLLAAGVGAGVGGAFGNAGIGALIGAGAGFIASTALNPTMNLAWDKVQEDEADQIAFKAALAANYDVNEVPKLYMALQNSGRKDSRVTLGFLGSRKRVRERIENCNDLIQKAYAAEVEAKKKQGQLIGDNPEFRHLMAELKRDNGILAFYHDMFEMARNNLGDAVAIRSNDPAAHYYYGKVLKLVGRTAEDRKIADQSFVASAKYDTRGQNFGAHLHHALDMMDDKTEANKAQIVAELQSYVNTYLTYMVNNAKGSRLLPPNLDTVYEYMSLLGDNQWMPKLPDDAPMFIEANQTKPAVTQELTPAAPTSATPAKPQPPQRKSLIPIKR